MSKDYEDFPLPEWAIGLAHGQFVLGAHLATRDGRRHDNGHIIKIEPASWDKNVLVHTVLTDAGNEMRFTTNELNTAFYPPHWVSAVDEVKRKFSAPQPTEQQLDVTLLVEALESIAEYWNQDNNEDAMLDAYEYARSVALVALATYHKQGDEQ